MTAACLFLCAAALTADLPGGNDGPTPGYQKPRLGMTRDFPAEAMVPAFTETLDSLRVAFHIPGFSAAVLHDGRLILARGFGVVDVETGSLVTAETPYNIASVAKPISAVVALRLVQDGRLDLDRPLAEYSDWSEFCAEFSEQPSIFARDLVCDPPVHTLRHLLTHTALGRPGERFFYNPVLYSWASRPMMAVTDTTFSSLVVKYVFEPAAMNRSARINRDLPLRDDLAKDLAPPHREDSTGVMVRAPDLKLQGDGAAGGVITTVLDLARFDRALDRGELISPALRDSMMSPTRSTTGEVLPYGIGWFVEDYEGLRLVWHSGWWEDAYSAIYLKVPERKLTLILLANSEGLWWDNALDKAEVEKSAFARAFLRVFLEK